VSKQQDMKNRMTVMLSVLDNVMKLTPFLIKKREYSGGLPRGI
jgi:hypothetical protein